MFLNLEGAYDAAAAKARVKEVLDLGGDGVTIPHVRNVDDAAAAIGFFRDARANVWVKGVSIPACGIGSLTQALGGDRAGAEAGTQQVLAEAKRAKIPDMLTANPRDVEQRVKEGFLALLMQGPTADDAIRIGRAAAGR